MIRRPPRSTHVDSSAASDVYKRQAQLAAMFVLALATTWFLRQSNDELSNFDTLLLDSLVIEDDDFADWYEENYVLYDID